MTSTRTIKPNKSELAALKYVHSARGRDQRHPALMGVNISPDLIEASDGQRYSAVQAGVLGLEGLCTFEKPGQLMEVAREEVENFPRIGMIIPSSEPLVEVALDARFLRDALNGLDGEVLLRIHGAEQPVEVLGALKGKGGARSYALIMPRRRKDFAAWRPHVKGAE